MGSLCSSDCCCGGVGWWSLGLVGSFLVSFSFLLGVDLCTIDSILPAGALVLVVWWGVGCLCGFWGYFSFDLAFVFDFVLFVFFVVVFFVVVFFVVVFFVVSFSTINKVVAGEKL